MAQHDYVIANASGATVRADINNMALAISSNNSGSSAPTTTYAYLWWIDTTNNVLKLRNTANNAWITMPFSITADNTVDINGGAIDGTPIGGSAASSGSFTTLAASGLTTLSGDLTLASATANKPVLTLTDTNADSQGPDLVFKKDSASPADGDELFRIYGYGDDSGGTQTEYFLMLATMEDVTDGTEDSKVRFMTYGGGSQRDSLVLQGQTVGIGTSSPASALHIFDGSANTANTITFGNPSVTAKGEIHYTAGGSEFLNISCKGTTSGFGNITFNTGPTPSEAMRIDSSGNLLVGKTASNENTAGHELLQYGRAVHTVTASTVHILNRKSNDGDITIFQKDGTSVGGIGTLSGSLYIASPVSNDSGIRFADRVINPCTTSGADRDDAINFGKAASRWDTIFAKASTINTSDRNEKQDIEELSDAEKRVAMAAKGLLKKYRWKSSVAEKGDDARIHFGIIAQDLQDAFAAEGLDSARYGMWCSDTWTNEDGEEQTRLGVRYSELLAFIISTL